MISGPHYLFLFLCICISLFLFHLIYFLFINENLIYTFHNKFQPISLIFILFYNWKHPIMGLCTLQQPPVQCQTKIETKVVLHLTTGPSQSPSRVTGMNHVMSLVQILSYEVCEMNRIHCFLKLPCWEILIFMTSNGFTIVHQERWFPILGWF